MTQDTIRLEISEDAFAAHYPLVPNHLNPNATWAFGDAGGCLFETYGAELAFVRQQDPRCVWTFLDGDDAQYVVSGMRFVNRIGYLISKVPVPDGVSIEVRIPSLSKDSDDPNAGPPSKEPAPTAVPSTPLLVPKGTPLAQGKMYLRLYHGRIYPDQQLDEWGFAGPTFGPLSCYVHTYCRFRIYAECGTEELWLEKYDDMIRWDGCFYGDFEVFIAGNDERA
jgi:hypothetical protein